MVRLSGSELAKVVAARIVGPQSYRFFRKSITEARLLRKFPTPSKDRQRFFETFKDNIRRRFFFSDVNRKDFYLSLITSVGDFESIMDNADMIHENKFEALGSGLFSFGGKVDWHLDFSRKDGNQEPDKRWPLLYYTKIDALGTRDQSDIKFPWELSRFHQGIWLGKAYWVSRSETHVEKFKNLVADWLTSNPIPYGVNWASPMEVAIRAVNLIIGLLYFLGSDRIDDDFFSKLLCSLYDHGVFIRSNLEVTLRSGNHYISNLVGLIYLGVLFNDTEAGAAWIDFARRELESEILRQVYDDGTDYEKSTGYHGFVTELFAAAYILLELNGFKVSAAFKERLEKMFAFGASATMNDGTISSIGDSDDGRVFKMSAGENPNDRRDLLAVGAVLFDRGDFKSVAGKYSELALLLLGTEGFEKFTALKENASVNSSIYRNGGFAFLKTRKDFCSFDFGDIGKRGRGGHGHNDILSFTLSGKSPLIVDRGTFCYTRDEKMRNKLRSAYSHNTGIVDGSEPAEFSGLWSVKKDFTRPELLSWTSSPGQDVVEARHRAYERLSKPVIHRRKITFNKTQRTFLLEDSFEGKGFHDIELMFHFSPQLKVVEADRNFLALEGTEYALIKFRHDFTLEEWDHSPSYGVLQKAKSARLKLNCELPFQTETFIFVLSSLDDIHYILNRLK